MSEFDGDVTDVDVGKHCQEVRETAGITIITALFEKQDQHHHLNHHYQSHHDNFHQPSWSAPSNGRKR